MDATTYYVRNKDEVKFGAAFFGMVVTGLVLSGMLARAVSESPLTMTLNHLFDPLGMNAAGPAAFLLGMYLTALALLGIDRTKRPQSIVLGSVTLIGLVTLAVNGLFFQWLGTAELAAMLMGVVAGVFYVGLDELRSLSIVETGDRGGAAVERRGSGRLEFRSAERLLYLLLAVVVGVGFFEAYTDYPPLLDANFYVQPAAFTEFRILGPEGSQLAVELAAITVGLFTSYVFLGYDAERSFFIAGPRLSGKTHAAIALHKAAVTQGYDPRAESDDLLEMESELIETKESWLGGTHPSETNDLSFSFTSKGLLRKNVRLQAIDYGGELMRTLLAMRRYYSLPETKLTSEYGPNVTTREQWLETRVDELRKKDYHSILRAGDATRGDGGSDGQTRTDGGGVSEGSSDDDVDPLAGDSDAVDSTDDASENRGRQPVDATEATSRTDIRLMKQKVWPAFESADTLLLLVDIQRYLEDDPVEAEALLKLYDNTDKEAIVLVTKADLIAEEFAESHGWKTPWAREPYDDFRTHVRNKLSEHDMLSLLFDRVERPYPVGYQTVPLDDPDERYERNIDLSTDLGNQRLEVHGYEYVLERIS